MMRPGRLEPHGPSRPRALNLAGGVSCARCVPLEGCLSAAESSTDVLNAVSVSTQSDRPGRPLRLFDPSARGLAFLAEEALPAWSESVPSQESASRGQLTGIEATPLRLTSIVPPLTVNAQPDALPDRAQLNTGWFTEPASRLRNDLAVDTPLRRRPRRCGAACRRSNLP